MVRPNTPASELLDAGAQLDAIIASGRVPDPTDSRELPAHLERARRRAAERHPPPSAASVATRANDGVAPPISDLEGTPMVGHRPDDSIVIILLLVLLGVIAGFLLGQWAALLGVVL